MENGYVSGWDDPRMPTLCGLRRRGYTPKVKPTKSCNACSLKELCLPKLMKSRAVSAYLRAAMEESP